MTPVSFTVEYTALAIGIVALGWTLFQIARIQLAHRGGISTQGADWALPIRVKV